jgi:hypothetical protein
MEAFKVICINDASRPNVIPISKWVKTGETYTVIQVDRLLGDGGKYGFKLAEIDLNDYQPYSYYNANRFAIPMDISELEEALKLEETL